MIKYVLWDVDATLLNFSLAESAAMRSCFNLYGFENLTDDKLMDYKKINQSYWKRLERGEITRKDVLEGRFYEFFKKYSYDVDKVADFNLSFQKALGQTYVFNDRAKETIDRLSSFYDQYAVTNGSVTAQEGKLKGSGLDKQLKDVFISEKIGYEKPAKEFFDYVFKSIGSYDKSKYIIIGDSLTSDIKGGNIAGIKTVWFNPSLKINETTINPDFEIDRLDQVIEILGEING
ncbi:MAG: YjjG family noncanonical pyrimidine nucleotidase [Tissierellia bacterium]|nr:YjjG family noncanonical pyrimidine nucleotidase [Tissierellia bacterium]